MSEFLCYNKHLMTASDEACPQCGAPVYLMDGMTDRQLRQQEYDEYQCGCPCDDMYYRKEQNDGAEYSEKA